jgi:hypothetical protein
VLGAGEGSLLYNGGPEFAQNKIGSFGIPARRPRSVQYQITELPWEHKGWLDEATAWIDVELAKHGRRRTAPVEVVHQRPWSTFMRIPTDRGITYFKAPAPPFSRFEAPLTEALSRWRPDLTVPLIAIDRPRGWFLSEDAGRTLREAYPGDDQVEHWIRLLPQYAELQLQMASHLEEMLRLGMFDRRLEKLPQLYSEILEPNENLRVGLAPGLTPDEHARLLALKPQLTAWCIELAAFGLPETLTHEEVHDANVLVAGDRYIFVDWSDSSVAHPFFSMVVTIRAAAYRLKLDESGPEMRRIRDAYLEPWAHFGSRSELIAAYVLAYRLGMLNRALSWHHGTGALPLRLKQEDADAVPEWLQDFLKGGIPLTE